MRRALVSLGYIILKVESVRIAVLVTLVYATPILNVDAVWVIRKYLIIPQLELLLDVYATEY
jgi:hypothetical protein